MATPNQKPTSTTPAAPAASKATKTPSAPPSTTAAAPATSKAAASASPASKGAPAAAAAVPGPSKGAAATSATAADPNVAVPAGPPATDGTVQSCHNLEEWNKKLEDATVQNRIMIVGFKAKWCGPCKLIAPIFVELAKKQPSILFVKIDVDELMEVATQWNVQGMPTFLIIKDAKELERVVGANKDELEKRVTWHAKNSQTS